jgi:hypothetical protein
MILVGKVHKLVKLQELINSLEKRRQEAYALQQNSLLFFNNNPCLISNLGTPQKKHLAQEVKITKRWIHSISISV